MSEIAYKLPMNVIADIVGIPVEDREWLFSMTNDILQADAPERRMSTEERIGHPGRDVRVRPEARSGEAGRTRRTTSGRSCRRSRWRPTTVSARRSARSSWTCSSSCSSWPAARPPGTLSRTGSWPSSTIPTSSSVCDGSPGAIPLAVEEILRWSSPVSCFARRATRDTEIRGVPIAEGDRVTMWYPSANRDEDVFDDPFRFDITRSPNPHVAFGGGGVHFCLGANLARRELTTLLEVLFERTRHDRAAGQPFVHLARASSIPSCSSCGSCRSAWGDDRAPRQREVMDLGTVGVWWSFSWNRPAPRAEPPVSSKSSAMGRCGLRAVSIRDCRRASNTCSRRRVAAVVASGIVTIWTATPEQLGSATAELEASYPGRFLLGLGTSHAPIVEEYVHPYRRMVEFLDALDDLDAPVHRDRRVLAALGPRMLELAAARALGAHPYFVPVEHTERARRSWEPVRSSHPR